MHICKFLTNRISKVAESNSIHEVSRQCVWLECDTLTYLSTDGDVCVSILINYEVYSNLHVFVSSSPSGTD